MPMEIFLDLKRKFLRKLVGKISRTSFPFLSGDSYKLKCDFKLSTDFAQELQKISTFKSNSFSIFCPVFLVNDVFECIMKHKEYDLRNFKLYIHNGDFKPDKLKMELLANRFERVYSVNWLGSREIAIPIPTSNKCFHSIFRFTLCGKFDINAFSLCDNCRFFSTSAFQ